MKHFLTTFLAVIVAQLFLLLVVVVGTTFFVGILMMGRTAKEAEIPADAYLIQSIPANFPDYEPERRLPIPRRITTQTSILENLEKAARDSRVRGVILKIEYPQVGWAKLEEIRARVAEVRAAHKPVIAFADITTHKALYLAAACDSIYMPPQGMVWLSGLMAESYHLKGLLDKAGVRFQVSQIKEYKSAAEMVTRTDISAPVRENLTKVLTDLYQDFTSAIAADRRVGRADVDVWLETAMFDPEEAVRRGIIDGVLNWEALLERLKGSREEFVSVKGDDYVSVPRGRFGLRGKRIAVVHGQGMITMGQGGWAYPFGASMGDESMVATLDRVRKDDSIAGVVLRLDTPGGVSLASDRIGQAVERLQAEKPMVVSSGDLNASGGYMVSYRCSTLVALPNSIIGSIGSFALRPSIKELMDKLGITFDRVTIGPHGTQFSLVNPLTPEEFARFDEVHWEGYDDWVAGVAEHRGMTIEQVDRLARGQVFTGRQALANGLIDELGGLDTAVKRVKQRAGIAADAAVSLVHYPLKRSLWEEISAGDWTAAFHHVLFALGLRSEMQDRLEVTIELWRTWLEEGQTLAVHEWRY